jgi:hypothetical protein
MIIIVLFTFNNHKQTKIITIKIKISLKVLKIHQVKKLFIIDAF